MIFTLKVTNDGKLQRISFKMNFLDSTDYVCPLINFIKKTRQRTTARRNQGSEKSLTCEIWTTTTPTTNHQARNGTTDRNEGTSGKLPHHRPAAPEIETSLAPVHLRLQSRILRSITRFQTLPQKHPIHQCIKRAATTISMSFTSPLKYLATTFPEYMLTTLEAIYPFSKPPWWQPTAHIDLSSNKKDAKQRHDRTARDPNTICIYMD